MSRFVSGGTNEEPTERDDAWLKAQQEIEIRRREKAELGKQHDGKSLYETLQANKAAKQEQFEQSIRLSNQFQALNEDEVGFLDSVLESTRAREAAVRQQTAEELDAFKRQQEAAEKVVKSAESSETLDIFDTAWTVGKKRKKGRESLLGSVKLRKSSADNNVPAESLSANTTDAASKAQSEPDLHGSISQTPARACNNGSSSPRVTPTKLSRPSDTIAPMFGLGAYSSDENE